MSRWKTFNLDQGAVALTGNLTYGHLLWQRRKVSDSGSDELSACSLPHCPKLQEKPASEEVCKICQELVPYWLSPS
jgi:hypothetical protein